nr:MFS transporter [Actinomycetales bacterium]
MSTAPTAPPNVERLLLIGAVALITIGAFENLAVTTILPVIARDLDGFAIYALAAGLPLALQVVANALGGLLVDSISFQRPLLIGVVTTGAGLLTAGLAPEMWTLAIGRGVAGFGIGFITVSLYAAVGLVVPPERRPGFFAAFSAAWVVPSMVGPAIAGVLADAGWWRAVLIGVVPLAVIALLLLRPLLATAPSPPPSRTERSRIRRRATSMIPAAVGLAAALAVVQSAGAAGSELRSLVTAGTAFLVVLVLLPLLLPPGTFSLRRGVPAAIAARLFINGAVIGTEAYLPLLLQEGHSWSPTASGLVLTAGSVSWSLGAILQARIRGTEKRYRWSVFGTLLVALGVCAAAAIVIPAVPPAFAAVGMLIAGLGMGITFASLSVFALDNTPGPRQGETSAALQIADGSGAALAIAVVGVVIAILGRDTAGFGTGFAILLVVALASVVATARVRKLTDPAPAPEVTAQ